jgi:Na+-driven multidrug efflux pump
MANFILLVASAVPFLLLAAVIRGGLRGYQDRRAAKRDVQGFD